MCERNTYEKQLIQTSPFPKLQKLLKDAVLEKTTGEKWDFQ